MTEHERRHFEVLLEAIKHSVEIIAEGHIALDQKIESFRQEAKQDHHLVMDMLKYSHDELKAEIQLVDKHSEERDKMLAAELHAVDQRSEERDRKLDARIDRVRMELKETKEELSTKIEYVGKKVEGHEDRIRFLERKKA